MSSIVQPPTKPPTPAGPAAASAEDGSALETNRAFYGTLADGRDDYWRFMAAPRHRVSAMLRELARDQPRSIADLGCGNGAMLLEIRDRLPRARLAGVDLSAAQISRNQTLLPEVEWHAANLDGGSPLPDALVGRFDAVVAMEIVEHLDDPGAFLTTARGLAAPGSGKLYLSTQSGRVGETERRVGHRRHFTVAEMERLLEATGWHPERVWNTGWPFHDLSKWYANLNPDASMRSFGTGAYGLRERAICGALRLAFRLNSSAHGAQLFAVARA